MSNDHISDAVALALAQHIAESSFITFTEMNEFLRSRGVDFSGDEYLMGEHLRLSHVREGTLYGPVSIGYIRAVEALFRLWPVTLEIADPSEFCCGEEPWHVVWTGGPGVQVDRGSPFTRPPVNRDVQDIADAAKYGYARCTQRLATMQYRLAELAGTGRLDPDESMALQVELVRIWEALYAGTLCAVRDEDTDDRTWDAADNTYSDGRRVITKVRNVALEESDDCWMHNPCMSGDGAPNEFPRGIVSSIALPPRNRSAPPTESPSAARDSGSLQERMARHRLNPPSASPRNVQRPPVPPLAVVSEPDDRTTTSGKGRLLDRLQRRSAQLGPS